MWSTRWVDTLALADMDLSGSLLLPTVDMLTELGLNPIHLADLDNQRVHGINTRMVTELQACRQRTYDCIGNFLACVSKVEGTNVISFKTLSN